MAVGVGQEACPGGAGEVSSASRVVWLPLAVLIAEGLVSCVQDAVSERRRGNVGPGWILGWVQERRTVSCDVDGFFRFFRLAPIPGRTKAKDLQEGDTLIATSGNRLPLDKIERVVQSARVYNFEVRDLHSYLVGRVGVVVHNCGLSPGRQEPIRQNEAAGEFIK
jgi:Pretoxin HINT domain